MTTAMEQAISREVNERINDAAWADLLGQTSARMNAGFYPHYILESIVQKHTGAFTIYDAYPFLLIWSALRKARILMFHVSVGETPFKDCQVGEMNKTLAKLPSRFAAHFVGGLYESDGDFKCLEPTQVNSTNSEVPRTGIVPSNRVFPLEVGTTASWKTLEHLHKSGGLARWPYASHRIMFFYAPDGMTDK